MLVRAVGLGVCRLLLVLGMVFGAGLGAEAQRGMHPLRVRNGVLTVNGLPAETGLNLRIANLRYLYVCLPGVGTAVIGEQPFAGAHEQRGAFHGNTLTVMAEGSRVQLSAAGRLRSTRSAYVRFDRGVDGGMQTPALSYGDAEVVPAVWPQQGIESRPLRRHVKVKAGRPLRTAKLCRPSSHGGEQCALVREVVYKP